MTHALLTLLLSTTSTLAAPAPGPCVPGKVADSQLQFVADRSGYFPDDSEMEGGFTDRNGQPLRTLQAYLAGKASYVSVAMDHTDGRLPYGTKLRIPAVERYFGRCIEFRVVDTGGRFEGRGTKKIDICNDSEDHTYGAWSNGPATVHVVNSAKGAGAARKKN